MQDYAGKPLIDPEDKVMNIGFSSFQTNILGELLPCESYADWSGYSLHA